jgi:phage gpG-like protein
MAVSLSISVQGAEDLHERLNRINPKTNPAWVRRSMLKSGLRVQEIASKEKILRGGKGPPVLGILTSRTGTLRRSIRVNRSPLPWAVEIGTDLIYGAVHESGGKYHPARPFLKPALEDVSRELSGIFAKEWAKELP